VEWGIDELKEEMETPHEKYSFRKNKIFISFSIKGPLRQLLTPTLGKPHIQGHIIIEDYNPNPIALGWA
jgi:hypothetical protein